MCNALADCKKEPPGLHIAPGTRVTQGIGDTLVIRDTQGRRIGTVTPNQITGGWTVRNKDGKRLGTIDQPD